MLNLAFVHSIINLVSLVCAYLITISPVGYFRAWVAYKMGDDTLANHGLLTFNPFAHIDFFGIIVVLSLWGQLPPIAFIIILFFYFFSNVGRIIPINPLKIIGEHSEIKFALALYSSTLGYFVVATLATILKSILIALFTYLLATAAFNSTSILVIIKILQLMVALNINLVVLYFIFSTVRMVIYLVFPPQKMFLEQSFIISMLVSLALMYFLLAYFGQALLIFFDGMVGNIEVFMRSLLGIK